VNIMTENNTTAGLKSIRLGELFDGMQAEIPANQQDVQICDLSCDSRKVKPGDLFFAVPGYTTDGSKFVSEAVSLGANAIVTESLKVMIDSVPVIHCKNIRSLMSDVADRFFDYPSKGLKVIGITGTNGKTTVSFLIHHIMKTAGENWGRIGTIGYFTGKRTINAVNTTPGAIDIHRMLAEMHNTDMNGCVMEVSSHALDQHRCDDVRYCGAIFMNLTQDHLDYHKDMESYFQAKSILFTELLKSDGFAVLNARDPYSEKLAKLCRGKIITFSTSIGSERSKPADVVIEDKSYYNNQRLFRASYKGATIDGSMPLPGVFNLDNAGAAIAAAIGLGFDFEKSVQALKNAPQVPGRVEKVEQGQPFEIIIDYAHTPDALKNLLLGVDTVGMKIIVFGCGGDRDTTKRSLMGKIASKFADRMFITSDNPRTENPGKIINDILKGVPEDTGYSVIEKRDEAIRQALETAKEGDLVIIAGKGHEDYQVVGNTRHYFSDPAVVKNYLGKMGYESN